MIHNFYHIVWFCVMWYDLLYDMIYHLVGHFIICYFVSWYAILSNNMIIYRMKWCCNIWNANISHDMIQFCLVQYEIVSYVLFHMLLLHTVCISWYHFILYPQYLFFFYKRSLTIIYIYYDQGSIRSLTVMHCLGERFDKLLPMFLFDIEYSVSKFQDLNMLSFCLIALMMFVLLTLN